MLRHTSGNMYHPTNSSANKLTWALLLIYLLVLVWILLFKLGVHFSYMEKRNFNLIPFGACFQVNRRANFPEMILNALIFVPLGIYTGLLFRTWLSGKKILLFFILSTGFEVLQYTCRIGAFDSTDIATNTLGAVAGLLICQATERLCGNSARAQKIINTLASMATIFIIGLLVLLKLNLLPIKYQ